MTGWKPRIERGGAAQQPSKQVDGRAGGFKTDKVRIQCDEVNHRVKTGEDLQNCGLQRLF